MNYLGHFVFNHEICGVERLPYLIMGVALPDLWSRYSRSLRIRWNRVRGFEPRNSSEQTLKAGLLNHIEADRWFHGIPSFLKWNANLRGQLSSPDVSTAVADFLAHVALELVLDHRLVCDEPARGEDFYDLLAQCDSREVERIMGTILGQPLPGLAAEIDGFIDRRFLPRFRDTQTLAHVLQYIGGLTRVPMPAKEVFAAAIAGALERLEPARIWSDMSANLESSQ